MSAPCHVLKQIKVITKMIRIESESNVGIFQQTFARLQYDFSMNRHCAPWTHFGDQHMFTSLPEILNQRVVQLRSVPLEYDACLSSSGMSMLDATVAIATSGCKQVSSGCSRSQTKMCEPAFNRSQPRKQNQKHTKNEKQLEWSDQWDFSDGNA